MAFHELSLVTLGELDSGKIPIAWAQALKRAALDLEDRPNLDKARKISLEVALVPIADEQGFLDTVSFSFKVKDTIPPRESKSYSAAARKGGQIVFNDLSPDNANQSTLDME